jgi:hypothetical protein
MIRCYLAKAAIFMLLALLGGCEAPEQQNIVKNGDFSQGLKHWKLNVNNKGKITVTVKDSQDRGRGKVLFIERLNSGNDGTYSGVTQMLDLPINSVVSLILEAELKPEMQSLRGTGWFGGECPAGIRLRIDDPSYPKGYQLWHVGFYLSGENRYEGLTKAKAGEWQKVRKDLTGVFPVTATIKYIQVIGSGWDYRSTADNVCLLVTKK